jgi:Na+-translocating ferredoxin:NAD+ oxidoreductase RnfG subunit
MYLVAGLVIVMLAVAVTRYLAGRDDAAVIIGKLYPEKVKVHEVTEQAKNDFIENNFQAVQRIYLAGDTRGEKIGYGFLVKTAGYNGPMSIAVGIDGRNNQLLGIKVLEHVETPEYAKYVDETWFTGRFKEKSVSEYLRLVVLDPEKPQDIVQITGATVTSQGVINGVNAAVGAFNYINSGMQMAAVPVTVDKLISEDENSFTVNWGTQDFIRITTEELKKYAAVKVSTVLMKTTGTKEDLVAEGPLLSEVLKKHGINIADYEGIGITGRDGYYAMLPRELLDKRQIILSDKINGDDIYSEDKPVRVVVPDEMGVYWVKMVSSVDLYEDIPEKDIKSVKMFDALTRDIEPYMYEYYGSKDKAIEIGRILAKFKNVNPKGFFTMTSSDGLSKNEIINMVRQRYYIKTSGENAPMNIAPNFKLGMNVKYMAYFSTTEDAVIFPQEMQKLTGSIDLAGKKGMSLADILTAVGVISPETKQFELVTVAGVKTAISGKEIDKCILTCQNDKVTALFDGNGKVLEISELMEINEIE